MKTKRKKKIKMETRLVYSIDELLEKMGEKNDEQVIILDEEEGEYLYSSA